jgi:hypothetical protein
MLTIEDLFAQPDNAPVLQYLGVRSPADVTSFAAETDNHALDEGGQIFFHTYGRRVPAAARDLTPYGGIFFGGLIGYTMDGNVDMSALGPGWVLFNWNDNEEDEDEPFWLAYVLAGR